MKYQQLHCATSPSGAKVYFLPLAKPLPSLFSNSTRGTLCLLTHHPNHHHFFPAFHSPGSRPVPPCHGTGNRAAGTGYLGRRPTGCRQPSTPRNCCRPAALWGCRGPTRRAPPQSRAWRRPRHRRRYRHLPWWRPRRTSGRGRSWASRTPGSRCHRASRRPRPLLSRGCGRHPPPSAPINTLRAARSRRAGGGASAGPPRPAPLLARARGPARGPRPHNSSSVPRFSERRAAGAPCGCSPTTVFLRGKKKK